MDEEGMPQWLDAADEHYYSMEVDDEYQKQWRTVDMG
jgi:hypothetical protein